ncbi:MAG TPA: hypothetical protein VFX44_01760 [Solirubrobacterales bacterium]|nr:hypothetical protein [Solirubrobacterales bacterium]
MTDAPQGNSTQDRRPPRGALIVVAVGLVACLVAALATVGKGEGEAANLEWVQNQPAADSKTVPVPGGHGEMSLVDNSIHATGTNVSGYSLFDAASTLKVSAGSPLGGSRLLCAVKTSHGTEVAQSSGGLRATYPRSSEDGIYNQLVPETVLMDFSSHSSELALLEVPSRPAAFTTEQGVKVGWPEYKVGVERIKYYIAGKPKQDLELPFFTIWKATAPPEAAISCTLTTSAGTSTVRTKVALAKVSPPIDEEAEEEKAEAREEAEEEKEEGEEG